MPAKGENFEEFIKIKEKVKNLDEETKKKNGIYSEHNGDGLEKND